MKKIYLLLTILSIIGILLTGCSEDEATEATVMIDYPHHEIHEGNSYFINGNDDDLDSGENITITIITPNTLRWMHATFNAEGTDAIHLFLYEGAAVNSTGSAVMVVDRDRNSSTTTGATIRTGDTFSSLGTLLYQWHTRDKHVAGQYGSREEIILKQNTTYLYVIESEVNDNGVSAIISWYEHTNK